LYRNQRKGYAWGNAPCRNRPDHDGLHDCVGTEFDPQQTDQSAEPCLVNVCQFTSGHAANIVPGQAIIKGTVRCFDETVRTEIKKQITNICSSICKMKGCVCDLIYDAITPSLVNAEKETKIAVKAISALGYTVMERPAQMISEDFACLSQKVPAVSSTLALAIPKKDSMRRSMRRISILTRPVCPSALRVCCPFMNTPRSALMEVGQIAGYLKEVNIKFDLPTASDAIRRVTYNIGTAKRWVLRP
jgi:hypothetical protein